MQKQHNKHLSKLKKHKVFGPVATNYDSVNTGSWRLFRPEVRYSKCIGCKNCQEFCPSDIIEVNMDYETCVTMNWEYCKGCGICANVCPKDCIEMVEE
jgi:pyruvate ferredoxin oxidoreductase delta subunit